MKVRTLHWVFKVADRAQTMKFYREVLGMKVLRHEEFTEGCAAACNGPYDNRWSKTMIGYGPEDTHFVVELTYNYGVNKYARGNEFIGLVIKSREAIARAKALEWPIVEKDTFVVEAPGGYPIFLIDEPQPADSDPVQKVLLSSSNIEKTLCYWNKLLNAKVYNQSLVHAEIGFDDRAVKIKFIKSDKPIERKQAFGRIAFAVAKSELPKIEELIKANGHTVLTPLVTLDTPGKASVTVVILADPDGHEICFVDEEGFTELSKVDPQGDVLVDRYIKKEIKDAHLIQKKEAE